MLSPGADSRSDSVDAKLTDANAVADAVAVAMDTTSPGVGGGAAGTGRTGMDTGGGAAAAIAALSGGDDSSPRKRDPNARPVKQATVHLDAMYHKCNAGFKYSKSSNPRRVLTEPSERVLNNGTTGTPRPRAPCLFAVLTAVLLLVLMLPS
jgi:hypothetical protein